MGKTIFDRISGLLLIALGIFVIFHAVNLHVAFSADPVGPRPFPIAVGAILILCGAIIALQPEELTWESGAVHWIVAVTLACLIYPFLLHPLGFVLATTLQLWVLALALGGRLWPSLLACAISSISILVVIDMLLGLGLPRNALGF